MEDTTRENMVTVEEKIKEKESTEEDKSPFASFLSTLAVIILIIGLVGALIIMPSDVPSWQVTFAHFIPAVTMAVSGLFMFVMFYAISKIIDYLHKIHANLKSIPPPSGNPNPPSNTK